MELLTGKCKEDFENDFDNKDFMNLCEYTSHDGGSCYMHLPIQDLPLSMIYGILLDFFDSVEIFIEIHKEYEFFEVHIGLGWVFINSTRAGAITEAIKKANELYNQKQK